MGTFTYSEDPDEMVLMVIHIGKGYPFLSKFQINMVFIIIIIIIIVFVMWCPYKHTFWDL